MENYIVLDDQKRTILYALGNTLLSILLLVGALICFATTFYLGSFFLLTGVWFTIKYMFSYIKRWIRKTPICEFKKHDMIVYPKTGKEIRLRYKDVKEAKLIEKGNGIQLFIKGKGVTHPSGYYYIGMYYPFQKNKIQEVQRGVQKVLNKNNIQCDLVR